MTDLLKIPEAAARHKLSEKMVRAAVRAGQMQSFDLRRPGGRRPVYRVTSAGVEAWVHSRAIACATAVARDPLVERMPSFRACVAKLQGRAASRGRG